MRRIFFAALHLFSQALGTSSVVELELIQTNSVTIVVKETNLFVISTLHNMLRDVR